MSAETITAAGVAPAATTSTAAGAGGPALRRQLAATERRGHLRALVLVAPLLLFLVVTFVVPVIAMLTRAVWDPSIAETLPGTVAALKDWDGQGTPPEGAYVALVADFRKAAADGTGALIGKRLNYEISGIRSKIVASVRKAAELPEGGPYKDKVIGFDKIWGDRLVWVKIKHSGQPLTDYYVLRSFDLDRDADDRIVSVPANQAIYITVLGRTFFISAIVTLLTLVLAYPVAFMLAHAPERVANILLIFVLVPFWTSLLVRTTAWFVLLQDQGPINDFLRAINATDEPLRLIFSRFGTIVAMTHIQLPFTLLPIYSVMKGISPSYMRAARSLGGGPFYSFFRVYLPLTIPGIGAGCLLTFILCLGYYITPALVGGPADQMVSGVIETAMNQESNWGKASALGGILLVSTLILFAVYNRLVGIDKVKLG